MDFGDRLKLVRGNLKQEEFALKIGRPKATYGNWERGSQYPNIKDTNEILAAFPDINPTWLLTGKGPMKLEGNDGEGKNNAGVDFVIEDSRTEYGKRVDDKYCYIPLYDVKAAAGSGNFVDRERVVDFLAFKTEWIRVQLGLSPNDLYLIHVEGESMEPTLRPGDMILIDHRTTNYLPSDGIYVLRMDDSLLVKRLQRLPGSIISVSSDNIAYKPFTLDLKNSTDEVGIIGRVVWCGRRM
jgi:phage repressor protein C with HTH and peptisase S24 domain